MKKCQFILSFFAVQQITSLKKGSKDSHPYLWFFIQFFIHACNREKILKKQFDSLWLAAAAASSSVRHKLYINGVRKKEILKKWSLRIFIYR